ncbi:MAG: hypothetical protein AAGG75_08770 [Bacteroidota bacterium]
MKKLFLLFTFLGFVCFTANAQQCSKKSVAAKGEKAGCCAATAKAAAKLATLEDNIESRTCAKSGKVSYVRKDVCPMSGKVSYADVEYCTKSQKFVNVSPSSAHATQVSTEVTQKASCTAKKAACTKGKSTKANTAGTSNVKLVKQEN